jgi:hypothetical protein
MIISSGLVIKSSAVLYNAVQAFFFFFGVPAPEDNLKAWIDDDGFKNSSKADKSKSYLFDELLLAKKDFIEFLDSNDKMSSVTSNIGGAGLVNQYIQAYVIRIKKIRMMIDFKIYLNTSKNAYGIKKFSRVIGQDDLVKVKGKIPNKLLDDVEKELENAMWNEYRIEYAPSENKK